MASLEGVLRDFFRHLDESENKLNQHLEDFHRRCIAVKVNIETTLNDKLKQLNGEVDETVRLENVATETLKGQIDAIKYGADALSFDSIETDENKVSY